MAECLEIVRGAWEHESFSFAGEFFSFDNVTVTPRPIQQPTIPIWVGANSEAGTDRAARLADGWIVGFSDRLSKLVPRLERYRSLAVAHGRGSTVCLMRLVGLGTSRAEVEAGWLPDVYQMLRGYARVEAPADRGDSTEAALRAANRGSMSLAEMGSDVLIAGTPDDCIAGLERAITETGCDHVLIYPGGVPSIEMMELFSREVLPSFVEARSKRPIRSNQLDHSVIASAGDSGPTDPRARS
jgi:alkanesulfonate monooxygenase SsuD/methylene tetrahydromethanopterin reductase-like flavin-dependent oxidoreductase (luciferase family)